MSKTVLALLLFSFCLTSPAQVTVKRADQSVPEQSSGDDQLTPNARLYHPKHIQSRKRLDSLAAFVNSLNPNVSVGWEPATQCLLVRGHTPADVDAAVALLNRFDVEEPKPTPDEGPHPWIDFSAYLILATTGPAPNYDAYAKGQEPSPLKPVPATLQSAIFEMKQAFGYEHYYLVDMIIAEPRGEGEISGILPWNAYIAPYTSYSISYKSGYADPKGNLVLTGFQFLLKGRELPESKIRTEVLLHENQQLVLGKFRISVQDKADLFVVLVPKPLPIPAVTVR